MFRHKGAALQALDLVEYPLSFKVTVEVYLLDQFLLQLTSSLLQSSVK